MDEAAEIERAAIVRWLRNGWPIDGSRNASEAALQAVRDMELADAIERGEHLKGNNTP